MLHPKLFLSIFVSFVMVGFSTLTEPQINHPKSNINMEEQVSQAANGTIIQIIKLKSKLSEEELLNKAREREAQFKAIPGIIQKYYVKLGEGEYGGIYIWDSMESIKAFKESELAKTIPQAYQVIDKPSVELANILFQLRD